MNRYFAEFTDKKLGVAENRRYDLPLHKSEGTTFLLLLIALMTFLAMMALTSFFMLGSISERWSSGLENKLTIEIPAEDAAGNLLRPGEIENLTSIAADFLGAETGVKSFNVLEKEEIEALIAPWLGEDFASEDIPLPGLISVTLEPELAQNLGSLEEKLKKHIPNINLDQHEAWLNDLLRLTGSMQFSAFLIVVIIGFTCITAIAGAIKSRIAVHKKDVELLHLMGAHDAYIMKQFQRHALILSLQGGLLGVAFSSLILWIIHWLASDVAASVLPEFSFSWFHIMVYIILPFFIAAIGGLTARYTVLRELSQMP